MTLEAGKELVPVEPSRGTLAIPDTKNLRDLATEMLNSEFFANIKKAPQAMAIILHGAEIGLTPTVALQTISIVNGRMCISTTVLQALFQSKKGKIKILERGEEKARVEFTKPGMEPYVHEYTKKDAELEGLWGKDNWKKRPKVMLLYRAISGGLRVFDPGAFLGIMTKEEMQDYPGGLPDDAQAAAETQKAPGPDKKAPGRPKAEKPAPEAAPEPEKPAEAKTEGVATPSTPPAEAPKAGFEAPPPDDLAAMSESPEKNAEEEALIAKIKAAVAERKIDEKEFKGWLIDHQANMNPSKIFLVKLGKAIRYHGANIDDLRYLVKNIQGAFWFFDHRNDKKD